MLSALVNELVSLPTLALVVTLVWSLNCLLFAGLWRINREEPGVGWWFCSAVSMLVGFIFFADTAHATGLPRGLGFAVNNLAVLVGTTCALQGTVLFVRGKGMSAWVWGVLMLPALAAVLLRNSDEYRYLVIDPTLITLLGATAWVLSRNADDGMKRYRLIAVLMVCVPVFALLGRFYLALTLPTAISMSSHPYQKFLFVVLIGYSIGWVHAVGMLCYARAHKRLEELARKDPLTGLPNRRHLDEYLQREIVRCKRSGERFAFVMVDLDGFKSINDRYGHQAGDLVLQTAAQRLRETVRDSDFAARVGGDEFVVIVHDARDEQQILSAMRRMRLGLDGPVRPDGGMTIRSSIGFSIWPIDGLVTDVLWAVADQRMYVAKSADRARSTARDTSFGSV